MLVEEELYMVSDRGIASCLNALTGEPHWQHRIGSAYSASPFYSEGKIYFLSEDGVTTVVQRCGGQAWRLRLSLPPSLN